MDSIRRSSSALPETVSAPWPMKTLLSKTGFETPVSSLPASAPRIPATAPAEPVRTTVNSRMGLSALFVPRLRVSISPPRSSSISPAMGEPDHGANFTLSGFTPPFSRCELSMP